MRDQPTSSMRCRKAMVVMKVKGQRYRAIVVVDLIVVVSLDALCILLFVVVFVLE